MDHHCFFCDRIANPPTYGGTRTFCDSDDCGPDWGFTLGDDVGRRWGIMVTDESVYGPSGLLFVEVSVDGHRVFKHPCPVDIAADGLPFIPWNLYTAYEIIEEVVEGGDMNYEFDLEAYKAKHKELDHMMRRIAIVLHEECLLRGLWSDVMTGYRKAQAEARKRVIATFKGRVMEQIEELGEEDGISEEEAFQALNDLVGEMRERLGRSREAA